jgi:hypothetical protein
MIKKYIVRLTDQERDELATVIKKLWFVALSFVTPPSTVAGSASPRTNGVR